MRSVLTYLRKPMLATWCAENLLKIHPCAKGLECRHDFLVAIFHSEDVDWRS